MIAVTAYSCSKDTTAGFAEAEGQGSASFTIGVAGSTRATLSYPWSEANIRIYKITYAADDIDKENGRKELIRHYFNIDDLPAEMWLAEGDYSIDIVLGDDKKAVSTNRPYYHGYQTFTIARNRSTAVEVECAIQNTIVKVRFDDSVKNIFDDYRAIVMVGNEFRMSDADNKDIAVTFDKDVTRGYFIIPEGSEVLSFCFKGTGADESVRDSGNHHGEGESEPGEIHEHYNGYKLNPEQLTGYCYELTFNYPNDVLGYISWDIDITIDDTEIIDDIVGVNPSPKPTISGDGVDADSPKDVLDEISYALVSADKNILLIEITVDNGETVVVDCRHADKNSEPWTRADETVVYDADGIRVVSNGDDLKELTMTLGEEFLNTLTGGYHRINVKAYTSSSVFGEIISRVRTQGAGKITPVDKWNARGEFSAYVFDEAASEVKIKYRVKDSEDWVEAEAESTGESLYAIKDAEVNADTEYEYQLIIDGRPTGAVKVERTENGAQIYNSGFEEWSGSFPLLPYIQPNQWWDCGNHGSASFSSALGGRNITTQETDTRPESTGRYSAKLSSANVVIKFAAGNMFLGVYAGTSGTDGVIAFGKPFPYDYKPRALRFWYKSNIGAINRGSGAPGVKTGDPDINEIYIMLCNMGGPHIVNTSDKSTLVDTSSHVISYCPDESYNANSKNTEADGHVIASAVWNNTTTTTQWTMVEVPLEYNPEYEDEMPTYLMLTASASKYGDYFMGCDTNVLCLDDIELVY